MVHRRTCTFLATILIAALGVTAVARAAAPSASAEFFELKIRPLLAKNCYACHTATKLGDLQLDSREHILKGGKSGPAVVPGNPEESLMIQAVRRSHERLKMPPTGKLKDEEIADLAAWVKAGAIWPETVASAPSTTEYVIRAEQRAFWSLQPVVKPEVPAVKDQSWPKSDIDRFILAKLESEGLKPVAPAGKHALLRRVTFSLTGLPPTPEEMKDFVADSSLDAYAKVVDRLLASPHYGERWARYWLDLARYADGRIGAADDTPYANAYRYRDWVVEAFNNDLPYDKFVKAQIAADLLPEPERTSLLPALGFQALGPNPDDRLDVTTRTFLGFTVACARCHDHKFDPIPTKDYYSLVGVFRSSDYKEFPLVGKDIVDAYQKHQKKIQEKQEAIKDFIDERTLELSDMLGTQTASYMMAAWKLISGECKDAAQAAEADGLDRETVERWVRYLKDANKEHPYLKSWYETTARNAPLAEVKKSAEEFQDFVVALNLERNEIEDRNYVKLGGAKGVKDEKTRQYANLEFLDLEKYYLWRDLASEPYTKSGFKFVGGVHYYGPKEIDRFLSGEWKRHLDRMRADLEALKKASPPEYPFLHTLADSKEPKNAKVAIRGDMQNLGEEAPRRFLAVLCAGEPPLFQNGSGRLEMAEVIASPKNPLIARVLVNRVWQWHFGEGLVRTPGNFGQLGERPSHPELLDYLAHRFVENGWSVKALHRDILLSAVYRLSTEHSAKSYERDPDNRLLWRARLRERLDAEALRDSLLAVAGSLDRKVGGPPVPLKNEMKRRTLYGLVSRTQPDPMLTLFDFPNPNDTSEQRMVTIGPLQRLYFLNSPFVAQQAKALAERLQKEAGPDDNAKIARAYELLYGRPAGESEIRMGREFLRESNGSWPQYAQVLLSSSEFFSLN